MCKLELKYLQIKDSLLEDMKIEEFKEWIYIDMWGNKSNEIQVFDDLVKELERIERYDLLIELIKNQRANR